MNNYYLYNGQLCRSDELMHYGVLGMKWGKRKARPKTLSPSKSDSSVTRRVKNDYNTLSDQQFKRKYQASKDVYAKRVQKYGDPYMNAPLAKLGKKLAEKQRSNNQSDIQKEIAENKKNSEQKNSIPQSKSKHRLNLEEKYQSQGMSQKQAEMAADRRIRTEKIIAAAAGVTIAAAGVYAANKYIKNRTDQVIKSGMTMQRIEMRNTNGQIHDRLYAAKDRVDKNKYAGMLGITRRMQTGEAYMMKLEAKNDIKVASKKNAEKVFKELYDNDSKFREAARTLGETNLQGHNKAKTGDFAKMYENFNVKLVQYQEHPEITKFYDTLKSKGYNAIQDINDMKFSGYKAKNPLIIFGAKENLSVKEFRELSNSEISKGLVVDGANETAKTLAKIGSVVLPAKFATSRYEQTQFINDYRRQHPNTKLSDKEILNLT